MKKIMGSVLDKILFRNEGDTKASTKKEYLKIHPVLPHGELIEVLKNIWFVTGQVKMPMLFPPMSISRSMTVIKDPANDELTIVNSMRLDDAGLKKLDKIGKVTNVLRIGGFHGRDDAFYRDRYKAKIFALKGQVYTREMMKPVTDPALGYLQPDVWLNESDLPPVPNATLKWFPGCTKPEAILVIQQDGGILVTGDSLQHTPGPDKYHNWVSRILGGKLGFFKPYNIGPGWVQFAHPKLSGIRSIMELDFEHVLPGHGEAVIGGAKAKYAPAITGKIKGCHDE
jgi:hypothetical protein